MPLFHFSYQRDEEDMTGVLSWFESQTILNHGYPWRTPHYMIFFQWTTLTRLRSTCLHPWPHLSLLCAHTTTQLKTEHRQMQFFCTSKKEFYIMLPYFINGLLLLLLLLESAQKKRGKNQNKECGVGPGWRGELCVMGLDSVFPGHNLVHCVHRKGKKILWHLQGCIDYTDATLGFFSFPLLTVICPFILWSPCLPSYISSSVRWKNNSLFWMNMGTNLQRK